MKNTIINNKKGALANSISLPIAVISYLIIFVIFYFIYVSQGLVLEKEIIGQGFDNDYELILRNYMNSYVTIDGERMLVSDVVYKFHESKEDSIKSQLISQTIIFFDSNVVNWRFTVKEGDVTAFTIVSPNTGVSYGVAELQLPSQNEVDLYVKLGVFQ